MPVAGYRLRPLTFSPPSKPYEPAGAFGEAFTGESVSLLHSTVDSGATIDAPMAFLEAASTMGPAATPIVLDVWVDGSKMTHAVLFDRIENGRVYFRNPWGDLHADGTETTCGRVEDAAQGLYSMSVEDLEARFAGWHAPKSAYEDWQRSQPQTR